MGRRRSAGGHSGDSRRYADWINAAYDDLRAARTLAEDNTLNNVTAFHCQQCVEKALKGFILYRSGSSADGHNLTWLCRRAVSLDPGFSQWMDESVGLNRYYIETRYPTDIPTEIEDDRIPVLLSMTSSLFGYVSDQLKLTDQLELWEAY